MTQVLRNILSVLLLCFSAFSAAEEAVPSKPPTVPLISIEGAIGPAVGQYVIEEIARANKVGSPALIITIDTPGGLVTSLRDINQAILNSQIPILCLVHPQGARAASAGTFILYACHIAAMAPATSLGAATPVSIGGPSPTQKEQESSEPSAMENKVLNDSIAYIRSLAQLRGRNAEWAEEAVRDAATLSATEALDNNVINLLADSPQDLLNKLTGQEVEVNQASVVLAFSEVELDVRQPDWRHQFLATITNPNIAYLLMIIGIYGLLLEFYSPGFGVAGVVGAISLLVATYAFQMLPINYVGVGLIVLGLGLIVAESLLPSFGIMGFGGVIAFVLGSIFLIDSDIPELRVSPSLIYVLAATTGALLLFVLRRLWQLRHRQVVSGLDNLIGSMARVEKGFVTQGYVYVAGERWAARGEQGFADDEMVEIVAVEGLTLLVTKVKGG
ncbi:NfeD family protein [Vibrio sinaloensis]|uniref:NfeD family protein n=1 Tax=Photobacterium sp. (strain ATCC 43367) TaxID=379097 RepID=UPI0035EB881B